MGELLTEVQQLRRENAEIKTMLHQLTILVMKDKVDTTWLSEEDAAASLGISARVLRRRVKSNKYPWSVIGWRHTNGRNWQYSRKELQQYKQLTSTEA